VGGNSTKAPSLHGNDINRALLEDPALVRLDTEAEKLAPDLLASIMICTIQGVQLSHYY
jgi:ABC-type branched-subunit amino acid transport system ATPase component